MNTRSNRFRQAKFALSFVVLAPGITSAEQIPAGTNPAQPSSAVRQHVRLRRQAANPVRLVGYPEAANRSGTGLDRHSLNGTGLGSTQATGTVVASLRSIIARLHQAGSDHSGHRSKAIQHLDQAIWTLQPSLIGVRASGGGTTTKNINESPALQAQSVAYLRHVHQQLRAIEARMIGRGGNGPTQQRLAHAHVQRAVQELDIALAVR